MNENYSTDFTKKELWIDVYYCGKIKEYTGLKHILESRKVSLCGTECHEKICKPLKERYSRDTEICNPIFVGEKKEYIKKIRKDKLIKLDGIKNIT